MHRMFREKRNAGKWAAALAVLLALALCSATVFGARIVTGNIGNDNHNDWKYGQYQMNKTLTQTGDGYALELTAGGFDTYAKPIYTVLALDATSSMGQTDQPPGVVGETRWAVILKAAKAYAEAFFASDDGHEKYLAVVSFGYGARVHLTPEFASKNDIAAAASPAKMIAPDSTPDTTIPAESDYYLGGYRSDYKYIHAEYKENEGVEDLLVYYDSFNKADFFFHEDKSGAITFGGEPVKLSDIIGEDINDRKSGGVLNNISQYSGTNNEAGLLLAKDLLDGVGENDAYKNVILISDGESPATSTFAWLYEQPLAQGVHLGNVYERTLDSNLVDRLYASLAYEGAGRTVNFFDGNWHNVDYQADRGQRLVPAADQPGPNNDDRNMIQTARTIAHTTTAQAILTGELFDLKTYFEGPPSGKGNPGWTTTDTIEDTIDLSANPVPGALKFTQNTHALLDALGAYDGTGYIATGGAISDTQARLLNRAVNGLFWQGGALTEAYKAESTLYDASDFSWMPNAVGKIGATKILDYREVSETTNVYGSNSARDFTGQSAGRVKASGYSLYYIAVGDAVKKPWLLEYYASDSTHTQHFYVAKQNPDSEQHDPAYIGFDILEGTLRKIAAESSAPARGAIIHDSLAQHFALDLEKNEAGIEKVLQDTVVKRYYYDKDGQSRERVYTFAGHASDETGKIVANLAPPDSDSGSEKDDPVRIEIGADGKSISARVGTLWDTQTAAMWAAGNLIPEELQMAEEGVFYYKASVKFPVLIDDEAIGANTWTKSNNSAYFDFDTGRSPDYISPDIIFTSGGGGGVTPPPVETPEEDGEEEEQGPPPGEEDEDTQTVPPQPGTPVQPGTPDVPPVPYSPGGTLVPLDDGGFLEIDENGVPLGVWNYDEDEGAWIFDEEVPLALLPQTGAGLPAAGFAWLWVLPLLVLLWLLFVRPWLRRRIGSRARDGIL